MTKDGALNMLVNLGQPANILAPTGSTQARHSMAHFLKISCFHRVSPVAIFACLLVNFVTLHCENLLVIRCGHPSARTSGASAASRRRSPSQTRSPPVESDRNRMEWNCVHRAPVLHSPAATLSPFPNAPRSPTVLMSQRA